MKILVTGAKGFIGKNLVEEIYNIADENLIVYSFDHEDSFSVLEEYCTDCDFVFHLAGINRADNTDEFIKGNFELTKLLIETLKEHNNLCPLMFASSTQAVIQNPYGVTKKMAEDILNEYACEYGAKILIYRLPNVFGKWCRPNYNSAIATFCNNIANDLDITVNDRSAQMTLVYIDDVVLELINSLAGKETRDGDFCEVKTQYTTTLGEIVDLIYSFKESRNNLKVPDVAENSFSKKLYSTYLSYLPQDKFSYPLKMNIDNRGSFTEILRTEVNGQFSVNISKPHITKGQHWHNTKNEKFLVVSGKGVIRFRKVGSDEVIEYFVSGEKLEVVDIPTGYTHNIGNLGNTDLITFMWCNECFNPEKPDTYFLEV